MLRPLRHLQKSIRASPWVLPSLGGEAHGARWPVVSLRSVGRESRAAWQPGNPWRGPSGVAERGNATHFECKIVDSLATASHFRGVSIHCASMAASLPALSQVDGAFEADRDSVSPSPASPATTATIELRMKPVRSRIFRSSASILREPGLALSTCGPAGRSMRTHAGWRRRRAALCVLGLRQHLDAKPRAGRLAYRPMRLIDGSGSLPSKATPQRRRG